MTARKNWPEQIEALQQQLAKLHKEYPKQQVKLWRQYRKQEAKLESQIQQASYRAAEQLAGVKPGNTLRYVSTMPWVDSGLPLHAIITVRRVSFAYDAPKDKVWVNFWATAPLSRNGRAGGFYVSPAELWSAFRKEKPARCEAVKEEA